MFYKLKFLTIWKDDVQFEVDLLKEVSLKYTTSTICDFF